MEKEQKDSYVLNRAVTVPITILGRFSVFSLGTIDKGFGSRHLSPQI